MQITTLLLGNSQTLCYRTRSEHPFALDSEAGMAYATLMLKALYVLESHAFRRIYGEPEQADIAKVAQIAGPVISGSEIVHRLDVLRDVDVILSGWGGPKMDESFMAAAPNLKGVFYGAGSIKSLVTPAFWARKIPITSSWAANAIPVAEYTLAQILFSLKRGWQIIFHARRHGSHTRPSMPGSFDSTVGLVSMGMIGRRVAQLLQPFDMRVVAYDPFLSQEKAEPYRVDMLSLEEVFKQSDVVSLHTPWLKETEGLITGKHFASMKPGATFINTSRGAVVREKEMIEVLKERPDLWALLDVTHPEPPVADSPLWTLPNVVLTPHIAGSMDSECRRMGRLAVDELTRFAQGEPLHWSIDEQRAATLA